ncbi:MAG: VanZ family protein [Candidatus Paceibacterales bacterium]
MFKKLIKLWLPPFLWMVVIFILSAIPHLQATSDPFWNFITRKLAHILEYFILSFLIMRAFGFRNYFLTIIIALLYATSDEYHQTFVIGRSGKFSDIIFDLSGILLGTGFVLWKKLPNRPKKPKI